MKRFKFQNTELTNEEGIYLWFVKGTGQNPLVLDLAEAEQMCAWDVLEEINAEETAEHANDRESEEAKRSDSFYYIDLVFRGNDVALVRPHQPSGHTDPEIVKLVEGFYGFYRWLDGEGVYCTHSISAIEVYMKKELCFARFAKQEG